MDEILIEEKKYISSKRAAKVTGYAKDYIGQLCREGRVPARLIGRNWYVLETAIQDHRFGATDIELGKTEQQAQTNISPVPELPTESSIPSGLPSTWESPRYEVPSNEFLPSINRLKKIESAEGTTGKASEDLQNSWRAWFDRIADTTMATPVIEETKEIAEEDIEKEAIEVAKTREDEKNDVEGEVNIPIHAVYQEPPRELLPYNTMEKSSEEEQEALLVPQKSQRGNEMKMKVIQIGIVLLAMIMTTVAVIGTGYLDKYIISSSLGKIISGITVYNK